MASQCIDFLSQFGKEIFQSIVSRTSQLTTDLSSIWSNGDHKALPDTSRKSTQNLLNNSSKLRRKTLALGEKVPHEILGEFSSEDDDQVMDKRGEMSHLLLAEDDFLETCTPTTVNALTLPPTQVSGPLKGVFAYLEVYSGRENRSEYFADELRLLGASVCQRFLLTKVTHVIFREGRQSTLLKAWARKIPVVSVLWIDSCSKSSEIVPVDKFLVNRNDVNVFGKRLKCMQPKKFDAEVALSDDNVQKRVKRIEARKLMKEITNLKITPSPIKDTSDKYPENILVQETPRVNGEYVSSYASRLLSSRAKWLSMTETCTPESLRKQMQEIKEKLAGLTENTSPDSESQCESLSQIVRKQLFARNFSTTAIPSTPSASMTPSSVSRVLSARENSANTSSRKTNRQPTIDSLNLTPVNSVSRPISMNNLNLRRRRRTLAVEFDEKKSPEKSPPETVPVLPILVENDEESVEVQSLCSGVCTEDSGEKRNSLAVDAPDEKTEEESAIKSDYDRQQFKTSECYYTAGSSSVSVSNVAVKIVDPSRIVKTTEVAINTRLPGGSDDDNYEISASLKMRKIISQVAHNVMEHSLQQKIGKSLVSPRKRRLFDERRSIVDLTESPSTSQKENIHRDENKPDYDISVVFDSLEKKSPLKAQKVDRLRSSTFNMKPRSSAVQRLLTSRPSNEEFKILDRYLPLKPQRTAALMTTAKKTPSKSAGRTRRKTLAPGLVMTSVDSKQSKLVTRVVQRLGGFVLQPNVDHSTTHVVCGVARRTLNVLYGVVLGCKVVSFEWVVESQKKKCWLDADSFLISEFASSSVQSCASLFNKIGPICLANNTQPPSEHMKALVTYCGAKVTKSSRRCRLFIGQHFNCPAKSIMVNEKWLLDSIIKREALPFDPYVIG